MMGKMMLKEDPYFYVKVGEASVNGTGREYECLVVNGTLPAVKSKQTDKTYCVSWGELVAWAVKEGIDEEGEG